MPRMQLDVDTLKVESFTTASAQAAEAVDNAITYSKDERCKACTFMNTGCVGA